MVHGNFCECKHPGPGGGALLKKIFFDFVKKKLSTIFFSTIKKFSRLKRMQKNVIKIGSIIFLLRFCFIFFAYFSDESKKNNVPKKKSWKNVVKKILSKFYSWNFVLANLFSHFLKIFWNVCRFEFQRNRSKTHFFVEIFCRKKEEKLKFQKINMKTLSYKKMQKNRKIVFAYVSEH